MDRKETHIHEVELVRKPFTVRYVEGRTFGYPIIIRRTKYYGIDEETPYADDAISITKQQVETLIELLKEIQKEWIGK